MPLSRHPLSPLPVLAAVLALVLTAACAGAPKAGRVASSGSLDGFPSQSLEDIVYAQARFEDPRRAFGVDLLDERRVVPVLLSVQLRGAGQESAQILISPERMDLRLYLADGTPARTLTADAVASRLDEGPAARVRERRFRGGLLSAEPSTGFVFFELTPEEQFDESRGATVVHADPAGFRRTLDVGHSLIAFNVTIQSTQQPFYVGIER